MTSGVLGELADSSKLDGGIYDMAELGNMVELAEEAAEKLSAVVESELSQDHSAKYKLEVYFKDDRSRMKPYGGFVMAWSNGGFAHGGGDETIYFCPSKVEKGGEPYTCGAPIDPPIKPRNSGLLFGKQIRGRFDT